MKVNKRDAGDEEDDGDDDHDEQATAGQAHGRQGWDGKCVCS